MSPISIFRQSSKLTLAAAGGAVLTIPANLWVAHTLGPEILGKVNLVGLWIMYAGLVRPGFFEGANREVIHSLGQSRDREAAVSQNTGFVCDLLFGLIPALALAVAALLVHDPILRTGFAV